MKKLMVFVLGLVMGAMISASIEVKTLNIEAMVQEALIAQLETMGTISMNPESNELTIVLNTESTDASIPTSDTALTDHDEFIVEAAEVENHVDSTVMKDIITEEREEVLLPTVVTTALFTPTERSIMDVVESSLSTPTDEVIPTSELSESERVTTLEVEMPVSLEAEPSVEMVSEIRDESNPMVSPQLVQNPTHFYHSRDLNIWIERVQTGTQRYFWVEVENNSTTSPLKSQLADPSNQVLKTIQTLASQENAILAINASGHYSDNRRVMGPVLKNGISYGDRYLDLPTMVIGQDQETVWTSIHQSSADIANQGGYTTLSFGPTLIENGANQSLHQAKVGAPSDRHPRTVIGRTESGRWFFLVVDGRSEGAAGMTLYEIQDLLAGKDISYAYNLDGGGSTTLYFKGEILNRPSDQTLRGVGDFVYFN